MISLNLFYLAWIVLIPFSSQVLGDHASDEPAVILYAALLVGTVFLVSIPVALVAPEVAPWCWLALFVVPVLGRVSRQNRA